jgi:opacity protein-like surface antigen
MKKIIIIFLLLIGFQISSTETYGQYVKDNFKPYWTIGLSGGPNLFYGDIKEYSFFPVTNNKNEIGYGAGLHFSKQFTPVFGLRLQGMYGQLYGTHRKLNHYFDAETAEANLSAIFDFGNLMFGYNADRFFSPYAFMGIGVCNYKSRLETLNNGTLISEEGYKGDLNIVGTKFTGAIPIGIGFNFRLAHKLSLNLEYSFHILNTDYLDGTKSGFDYDMYNYTSLGLSYHFKSAQPAQMPPNDPIPDFTQQQEEASEPIEEAVKNTAEESQQKLVDYESMRKEALKKKADLIIEENKIIEETTETIDQQEPEEFNNEEIAPVKTGKFYRVQLIAKQESKLDIEKFKKDHNIDVPILESWYNGFSIYTVGEFTTFNAALGLRKDMIENHNLPGAFIAIFKDGERIKQDQ